MFTRFQTPETPEQPKPIDALRLYELISDQPEIIADMRRWITMDDNNPGRGDSMYFAQNQNRLDNFLAAKGFAITDTERGALYRAVIGEIKQGLQIDEEAAA